MKKSIIIAALAAVALIGCQSAPESRAKGSIFNQPYDIRLPKDGAWKGVHIKASTNEVTVDIESVTATNSPAVIDAVYRGRVSMVDATGKVIGTVSAEVAAALVGK